MKKWTWTQREVNEIFGHVPTRTLRWWGLMGLYGFMEGMSDGRGLHRLYGLPNLYQIGIVERLSATNVSAQRIREVMEEHFKGVDIAEKMAGFLLLGRGWSKVYATMSLSLTVDTVVIVLNLSSVKRWVDESLVTLGE